MKSYVFIFLFVCSFLRAEDGPYWQPAATLYQSGDYEAAFQSAEQLLEDYPQDAVLLRLQGMCLLEAGEAEAAVLHLQQAVTQHPTSVAMAFYLAQAYAAAGHLADAQTLAEEIIAFAPDSAYAARCQEVLPQLTAMQTNQGVTTEARQLLDVYFRTAVEQDDNVIGRADDDPATGPTDAVRLTSALWVNWRLIDQEAHPLPLSVALAFSAYRSWHDRSQFEGLNVESEGLTLSLSRTTHLFGKPLYLSIDGSGTQTGLDGEDYSEVASASARASCWLSNSFMLGIHGQHSWKSFEDEPEFPEYFSREGTDWSSGAVVDIYLAEGRVVLGLEYGYLESDADGSQFRYDSHNGTARIQMQLPLNLRLATSVNYQQSDYTEFLPDPTRIDDVWTYNASLQRPFFDHNLVLELGITHIDAESNQSFATYDQDILTFGVSLNL